MGGVTGELRGDESCGMSHCRRCRGSSCPRYRTLRASSVAALARRQSNAFEGLASLGGVPAALSSSRPSYDGLRGNERVGSLARRTRRSRVLPESLLRLEEY